MFALQRRKQPWRTSAEAMCELTHSIKAIWGRGTEAFGKNSSYRKTIIMRENPNFG
jgi:hypothetical protein